MELLDNQALDLFRQNVVLKFLVEAKNQHLREYYANRIITLYTKDGTYLTEARVEEGENFRKILPPKESHESYRCNDHGCYFTFPGRVVQEKNPACLRATSQPNKQRPTEFCKVHRDLCEDKYQQYKYVCASISDNGRVFNEEKIKKMSLSELDQFIQNAGACHDARYEQLKLCPSFDNKIHRGFLFFLEQIITFAYKQKISKETPLLSPKNKLFLTNVIPALDKSFLLEKLREPTFFYHVHMNRFTREELNYLFLLHMQES